MDSKDFSAVRIYNNLCTISILARQSAEIAESNKLLDETDIAMLVEISAFALQLESKMYDLMGVRYNG